MSNSGEQLKERVNKRISDSNKGRGSPTTISDYVTLLEYEITWTKILIHLFV